MTAHPMTPQAAQAWYTRHFGRGVLPPARWYFVTGVEFTHAVGYSYLVAGSAGLMGIWGLREAEAKRSAA